MTQVHEGIQFSVAADRIAPFVWLEAEGCDGHFSRNGFLLGHKSGQKVTIEFYGDVDGKTFGQKLTAKSLMDVYEH
jgi:hypothetical protein